MTLSAWLLCSRPTSDGLTPAQQQPPPKPCKTVQRISTSQLNRHAERAAEALGLPLADIWTEHTPGSGWSVFRRFGPGAQSLGDALTAREAQQLLRGLEIGAELQARQQQRVKA